MGDEYSPKKGLKNVRSKYEMKHKKFSHKLFKNISSK